MTPGIGTSTKERRGRARVPAQRLSDVREFLAAIFDDSFTRLRRKGAGATTFWEARA
jgi:hypothetical protein